jgi:hypothetical protein
MTDVHLFRPLRRLTATVSVIVIVAACGGGSATTLQPVQPVQPAWSRDVIQDYGAVSATTLQKAVGDAATWLKANPDGIATVHVGAGRFDLSAPAASANVVDLSAVKPGGTGRLVLLGQGPDKTTLVFNNDAVQFYGRSTRHVTVEGFHFTTNQLTVSQGRVVAVGSTTVQLEILPGFPTPLDIFDAALGFGRYLRRYTDDPSGPQLIETDNEQILWSAATAVSGRTYELSVTDPKRQLGFYQVGDLVCIKSKSSGQTYFFTDSSDLVFKNIRWTHMSRGVFRQGSHHISILDSSIERAPAIDGYTPCLSSAAGGPQFGQPSDPATSGNEVRGFVATATGDDAIAFFNSDGVVENARITDSFARGILLNNSPNVTLTNTKLTRNPLLKL